MIIASITGALAVGIGAFGAHGLKPSLSAYEMEIFGTGNDYHFYHTLAMFLTAILLASKPTKYLKISFYTFFIGIICFSGSLYLLATRGVIGTESWTWLGPITPIGGVLFIIGWICLGLHAMKTTH